MSNLHKNDPKHDLLLQEVVTEIYSGSVRMPCAVELFNVPYFEFMRHLRMAHVLPTPGPMCVLNSHSWFLFDGHWSPKSNAKYCDYSYTNGKLTRFTWASFYFTEKQKVLDSKPLLQTGLHPLHRSKEETQ